MGSDGTKPSKKAKLEQLLQFKAKLPSHSQSALQAFIEQAKEHGLPDLSSSNHQREAREHLLEQCHGGQLGPLLQQTEVQTTDGSSTTMFFIHLLVYLTSMYHLGGSFTQLMQQRHATHPSSPTKPWDLIIYCDEIIPGNVLGRAERKAWAVYASFLNFQEELHNQDLWLTIALERSTFISTVEGGIAQVMAKLVESIFCNPAMDPQAGILMKHSQGDIRLHFQWSIMLADGAAHKQVWSSKGDSGQKFCLLRANIRGQAPKPTDDAEPDELFTAHTKYEQLALVSDQDLLESYHRLDARRTTCSSKAEFAKWQMATGLTWNKHALMLNQKLLAKNQVRPVTQFCHDYMHGILQGTAPVVLYHTLSTIAKHMDVWSSLEGYIGHFQQPQAWKMQHLAILFHSKKVEKYKANHKFSSQASECLALFPVIAHFLQKVVMPSGLCQPAITAFLAMADLIDQCHAGTQHKATTRASLLAAAEHAIASFIQADFGIGMIKKWHWQLHLPDLLARLGSLPSCFTAERKHKSITALATRLNKTSAFEKHLLQQVVSTEITTLQQPDLFPQAAMLVKAKAANAKQLAIISEYTTSRCTSAQIASVARLAKGCQIYKEDVVVYNHGGQIGIGQVWFHIALGIQHGTFWNICDLHAAKHYAKCKISNQSGFIPMETIQYALVSHKDASSEEATVLLPYQFYCRL